MRPGDRRISCVTETILYFGSNCPVRFVHLLRKARLYISKAKTGRRLHATTGACARPRAWTGTFGREKSGQSRSFLSICKIQTLLYREPFEFAKCFTAICPLAPISSQILSLAGISRLCALAAQNVVKQSERKGQDQIECGRRSLRTAPQLPGVCGWTATVF